MKLFAVFCFVVSVLTASASETAETKPKHQKRTPRIIDGWHAIPGQFPHQALITSRYEEGHSSGCGGSLISDRWILTAAHCFHGTAESHVYLGSINYPKSPIKINTRNVHPHPDFDPSNYNNDIGLIDLNQSINFTDNIQPIRILSNKNETYEGQIGVVSGFGYLTEIGMLNPLLSFVNLTIISNEKCSETYEDEIIIPSSICAVGILSGSQGTCNGDSGGPMILQGDGEDENILIGVASFISKSGCSSSFPSGFVRPYFYTEWITSVTGIEFD